MITLTPDEVRARFGPLFAQKFIVMVDEQAGTAEILESCRHRGTIEWDMMNRRRAGGALSSAEAQGSSMTMKARLGRYEAHFGAAGKEIGGQALEGVEVQGEEVVTTWAGIAGAGVGVAACLPQAPGVIRAEYPTEEDLQIGGARVCRVRIVSPKYEKVTIGIDDTDTKQEGATWVLALKCAEACMIPGVEYLNMRLVQLNPAVPKKTTNCVGSVLNFAVRSGSVEPLLAFVKEYVESNAVSGDTGIAYYRGIEIPVSDYSRRIKTDILTREEVEAEAERLGITFIDSARSKGRIGALGAVLWGNRGVEAAGLYGE
ncbi:tRNA(Ile2) 2-agmatinylcytidine synthetase [Methanofollis fontis]|uniref:tRNA(Ile2) 2-agmatinylcytidine synthetase n=1 Tax=Methanofollis fontis TaxID=2052832 RepID=A0A483CZ17_9EURY|nr:tRNA(Ile2) 2-agmatinylcytidine synthetase [Methanofollis fontis]TAJ45209.1 tRNA(Ile2) 2-agmatinylcytidine synthetase [Methanofollis fontis]